VQQFDSEKLPQTLVSEIRPFLRAANAIEAENPRVAYLCKFCSRAITPCFLCLPFLLPFSPWSLEEASSQLLCRRPARATPVRGNARQGKLTASSWRAPRWLWPSNVCPAYVYFMES
jgi:hypothetical protein